jgi:uncharacterized membrane protein (DUF441 family)
LENIEEKEDITIENGVDSGIILLLGVVLSGLVLAFNRVVELFSNWVKWPKGWVNFITGLIVAFLALIGIRAWG